MSQLDEIIERVPTLVERLREPIDWAHFVSDDHAEDYAAERREAADGIEELEAALDAKEVEAGITSNGNLWRFWADKARETVNGNAALRARIDGLEAALGGLEGACDALAASRGRQTYLSMIDNDLANGLLANLDAARLAARNALSQVTK